MVQERLPALAQSIVIHMEAELVVALAICVQLETRWSDMGSWGDLNGQRCSR